MMADLMDTEIKLSNGDTIRIVHDIGEQVGAAFENWIIRAQSERDEPWFEELSSECFAQYIRSKGDVAMTWEHYQKEYAEEEE